MAFQPLPRPHIVRLSLQVLLAQLARPRGDLLRRFFAAEGAVDELLLRRGAVEVAESPSDRVSEANKLGDLETRRLDDSMFTLRKATRADLPEIERVMRESLREIGRQSYDEQQVASAMEWIARADPQLIDDGTYFVAVIGEEIVACGGWSKRGKLYAGSAAMGGEARLLDPATEAARVRAMFTLPAWARRGIGRAILEACEAEARAAGFRRVELMAMLSGEAMYAACGYAPVEPTSIVLEDGARLGTTVMTKTLDVPLETPHQREQQ